MASWTLLKILAIRRSLPSLGLALSLPLASGIFLLASVALWAEEAPTPREVAPREAGSREALPIPPGGSRPRLPLTGLAPAAVRPGLCVYDYPVATNDPVVRQLCNQALGYYYSYVWMEAARSYETAVQRDPQCAQAWLGLHLAMSKWGGGVTRKPESLLAVLGAGFQPELPDSFKWPAAEVPLARAQRTMPTAPHRTQLLITAKLQEKGWLPNTPADQRKRLAIATLDELLTLYPDDQEAWFARAQLAEGRYGVAPFYLALLKLNPLHPGAHHELVHYYENIGRPALGWPHALGYMQSSPGIPHAFHMQAHLGMRIGKWGETTTHSLKAIALQQAYHREVDVEPEADHQYNHHLETLVKSLLHDGRFTEAAQFIATGKKHQANLKTESIRLALMTRQVDQVREQLQSFQKEDKSTAAYYSALWALEQDQLPAAQAALEVLRQRKPMGTAGKQRLWEIQGRILCRTGQGQAGSALLKRAVDQTKNNYQAHAWGGGAYFMEAWGLGALEAGRAEDAEEAFLEALAHDSGSVRGALGLWALCDRLDRTLEAERYLALARRIWNRAAAADFVRLQDQYANAAEALPSTAIVRQPAGGLAPGSLSMRIHVRFPRADEPPRPAAVVSGVPVGKRCGPYSFLPADGPEKGKPTCYICEQEDRPTVVVFARKLNAETAELLKLFDAEAARRPGTGFKAWMTYLTPQADLALLSRWSNDQGLKLVPVGAFEDVVGPPAYRLAEEADLTVHLFVRQKVVANFAFRSGECTAAQRAEIQSKLPLLFPEATSGRSGQPNEK